MTVLIADRFLLTTSGTLGVARTQRLIGRETIEIFLLSETMRKSTTKLSGGGGHFSLINYFGSFGKYLILRLVLRPKKITKKSSFSTCLSFNKDGLNPGFRVTESDGKRRLPSGLSRPPQDNDIRRQAHFRSGRTLGGRGVGVKS